MQTQKITHDQAQADTHTRRMRAIAKRAVIDLGYIQHWIGQQQGYPIVENYCVTALDSVIDEINRAYPSE